MCFFFFFSSRRRHTRSDRDWSSDVCSSDLGRQPEGIPSHRVEDVEALRAPIAGDEIAHRVIADMPDMELARRVWEHFKNIVFWPCRVLTRLETPALAPLALPFRLGFPKIVT